MKDTMEHKVICDCGKAFPQTLNGYAAIKDHYASVEGAGCTLGPLHRFREEIDEAIAAHFLQFYGRDAYIWDWRS